MMKTNVLFILFLGLSSIGFSQTVTIGTQVWTNKNLDVSTFRNGDPIPEAKTDDEWIKAGVNKQPAWCYYNNVAADGSKYGKLYNWYAVNDSRSLAPEGYHIPTDAEWTILIEYMGGEEVSGKKMKSKGGWVDSGNGTNTSSFSGLPGGYRYGNGTFDDAGEYGYWWRCTENSTANAWSRYLNYGNDTMLSYSLNKGVGLSVRCIKD